MGINHDKKVVEHGTTLTIASSGTVSSASGDLSGVSVVGIQMNTWDSGKVKFQSSVDGTNYYPVFEDVSGTGLQRYESETLGDQASAFHWGFNDNEISLLLHARYLKVEAENSQGDAVSIKLLVREV